MSAPQPLATPLDFLTDFDLYLADQGRSVYTRQGYRRDLMDLVRYCEETNGEPFSLVDLTPHDLAGFKTDMRVTRRLSAATCNRKMAAIRVCCRWAVAEGRITSDPSTKMKAVRSTKSPPKSLERIEVNRLLRAASRAGKRRDEAIIAVMLHAGLRLGEVVRLRLSDLTIKERSGQVAGGSGSPHARRGGRGRCGGGGRRGG